MTPCLAAGARWPDSSTDHHGTHPFASLVNDNYGVLCSNVLPVQVLSTCTEYLPLSVHHSDAPSRQPRKTLALWAFVYGRDDHQETTSDNQTSCIIWGPYERGPGLSHKILGPRGWTRDHGAFRRRSPSEPAPHRLQIPSLPGWVRGSSSNWKRRITAMCTLRLTCSFP